MPEMGGVVGRDAAHVHADQISRGELDHLPDGGVVQTHAPPRHDSTVVSGP